MTNRIEAHALNARLSRRLWDERRDMRRAGVGWLLQATAGQGVMRAAPESSEEVATGSTHQRRDLFQ